MLVLEARPGLGGRATAFRDPETGERVDNGQHILMGCYDDTLAFLRSDRRLRSRALAEPGLSLPMIDRARPSERVEVAGVAVAAAFLGGVLAWEALSWGERLVGAARRVALRRARLRLRQATARQAPLRNGVAIG